MPYNDDKWVESHGEDRYRRGLYTFCRRTAPLSELADVRRAEPRVLHGAARAHQYAAAGADHAERSGVLRGRAGAGPARDGRRRSTTTRTSRRMAFRLCVARRPNRAELDRMLSCARARSARSPTAHGDRRGRQLRRQRADRSSRPGRCVANVLLEPGRDHYARNSHGPAITASLQTSPALLRRGGVRHRRRWRSGVAARTRRLLGAAAGGDPLAPKPPHFAPKAKRVIYLFMAGAPSQLDLFDHKPKLSEYDGQSRARGRASRASGSPSSRACRSCSARRITFAQHGQSGARALRACCRIWPAIVDDIADRQVDAHRRSSTTRRRRSS